MIQCKLMLIVRACRWGECFCRLRTGTGFVSACSFNVKPDHLVACFLITGTRLACIPSCVHKRRGTVCQRLVQITFTQLHSLVLYGYGTERLAGAQLETLQYYPCSLLTQHSGNPKFEGQGDSFYFYWYRNMKPFVMVGNPCLRYAGALWHCIGRISLY